MKSDRLEFLDGIRAIAAVYVVLHHIWLTVYPSGEDLDAAGKATFWLSYGNFGVTVFIVVSGFSLMISPSRHAGQLATGYWQFVMRRFRRIILPYWVALAVSLALALTVLSEKTGTHWDVAIPVSWPSVISHALGLQDIFYSANINHVLWSVALEWHIYFAFPLLLVLWRKWSPTLVVGFLVVVTTSASVIFASFEHDVPLLTWFSYLGLLSAGALACSLVVSSGGSRFVGKRFHFTWTALTGCLLVVLFVFMLLVKIPVLSNTILGLAVATGVIALSTGRLGVIRRALESRILIWLGTISFSLYLVHALVVQFVWQYVLRPLGLDINHGWTLMVLLPTGLIASVALASVFFRFGERPFLSESHVARLREETQRPPDVTTSGA